ncbi:mitochondrial DNA helicase isoform X1 [Hylaeus anthracinus]|uniref:mitochondrial DNA helicase isoform X1 n=1 Tax=Hylaeus anthracinus TaxID=313031 RepID=UPI0023BA0252|nr:mitochondrial DNA helicase isoform X1 [Hylaeus anthracinus]
MIFKFFLHAFTLKKKQQIKSIIINNHYLHTDTNSVLNISVSHLKQLFKQKCLSVVDGHVCLIADCPICNNEKKDAKLYVNKTTGFFMCDKCKCTGSWDILRQFLSTPKSMEKLKELDILKANLHKEQDFDKKWKDMKENCRDIMELTTEEYNALLDNFSLPDVSQQDMSQLKCIYKETSKVLYFPLIGLENSVVGYKFIGTDVKAEPTFPVSSVSGCVTYKQNTGKNDNTAVIVESIYDLLALVAQKSANIIICLPYNLKTLPQQLLPYMESFKKLTLWFGNDETSWYTARQFAKKLNEKRCYFVRPTDLQPQPKLAAEMGYNLKGILQNAQAVWHKSITTFRELREEVLSDLQNIDKVQGVKWKRYPVLNRILKGHRRGELTILTGPTGCGKTTFMSEYSLDLAMQGVNTLWGSFEIRNARLARTMLQQMVELPLDQHLDNFDLYADAFEKLPIYFMTFHGQQTIKVVMDAVEHATYVHDIAHVIIDNVQFMMGTSDDSKHMDRFWKQDDIIAKFRNFATKYNCHVTAIIHPRKERSEEELTTSSIFGGAKASQEADNVLIIQDKRFSSVRGKKYLQVAKNRYSGDLGIMMLEFEKSSLSYSSRLKQKRENTEKEKSLKITHTTEQINKRTDI